MEIFYSAEILDGHLRLDAEETAHCTRVMRHRAGDAIEVIDGRGNLYHCTLVEEAGPVFRSGPKDSLRDRSRHPQCALARIDSVEPGWGGHPYRLTLAVCPTKNPDRYEWMAEKATEVGLDLLVPVIGERSERRVLKTDRLGRILLSAAKQSLKGAVPEVAEPLSVSEFIAGMGEAGAELRLIAYCSDEVRPRSSIMAELRNFRAAFQASHTENEVIPGTAQNFQPGHAENEVIPGTAGTGSIGYDTEKGPGCVNPSAEKPRITVLIGPEGDFSPEEVRAAMAAGFIPVSLGASRLRTETAGITAAEAVYLSWM